MGEHRTDDIKKIPVMGMNEIDRKGVLAVDSSFMAAIP
jgi:hypothetical protein